MTEGAWHRPDWSGLVISLTLRVTAIAMRALVTGQYHKLYVPGARLAPPLALDSLLLPRYSTQPLSINHLLSMTIVPTQEDLCGTDCCRPSTSPGAAILVVCEYCTDRLYPLRAPVSTRGLPPLPGRLLTDGVSL
jgi:hypothetical protein